MKLQQMQPLHNSPPLSCVFFFRFKGHIMKQLQGEFQMDVIKKENATKTQ